MLPLLYSTLLAGVDGQTLQQFEQRLEPNLYRIWNRLSSGSYFPPALKGVAIPKKSGGERILGIPTVSDRIAQTVVKKIFEPLIEPIFHEDSYGYRPNRSAHDALAMVRRRCWKYDWVIEFDINDRRIQGLPLILRDCTSISIYLLYSVEISDTIATVCPVEFFREAGLNAIGAHVLVRFGVVGNLVGQIVRIR